MIRHQKGLFRGLKPESPTLVLTFGTREGIGCNTIDLVLNEIGNRIERLMEISTDVVVEVCWGNTTYKVKVCALNNVVLSYVNYYMTTFMKWLQYTVTGDWTFKQSMKALQQYYVLKELQCLVEYLFIWIIINHNIIYLIYWKGVYFIIFYVVLQPHKVMCYWL